MTQTQQQATVQVGDIFSRSWGYDQTNVDYYEIVRVSASGKTAKAKQIKSAAVAGPRSLVTAATGEGRFVEDPRCTRCGNHHRGEDGTLSRDAAGWDGHKFSDEYTWLARFDSLTVTTYGDHAWRWDGEPDYETPFGEGH